MLKKQVLKVKDSHSDEIIKMTESNTIYVDNRFYKKNMKEHLCACLGEYKQKIQTLKKELEHLSDNSKDLIDKQKEMKHKSIIID